MKVGEEVVTQGLGLDIRHRWSPPPNPPSGGKERGPDTQEKGGCEGRLPFGQGQTHLCLPLPCPGWQPRWRGAVAHGGCRVDEPSRCGPVSTLACQVARRGAGD